MRTAVGIERAVPSSIATLAGGLGLHVSIRPHWPRIVSAAQACKRVASGIYDRRFRAPLRDIVLDLLNRRPRLTDASALEDAQTSLATMLDEFVRETRRVAGGQQDRAAALAAVSRAYEREIKRGALRNIVQGKLVRLILIQVQLLKTELLKAMGAIDSLVDANRLNVQLLASVPALLLLVGGSRLSWALVHRLRTRGLRSMREVHAEMGERLTRLERCLVLAGSPRPQPADGTAADGAAAGEAEEPAQTGATVDKAAGAGFTHGSRPLHLRGVELGEFALHVHSYLLLLDFSSPAYTAKACDAIHHELQDLLRRGQLSVAQQAALLASVKQRHMALGKAMR